MVRDDNFSASPVDLQDDSSSSSDRATAEPSPTNVIYQRHSAQTEDTAQSDDNEWAVAREAWEAEDAGAAETVALSDLDSDLDADSEQLALTFVGCWNRLISSTNWEKGRIIQQWRLALLESGASPTAYSDEAWARRVGGVTASHVGRLRRVYQAFGESYESYSGLYWTHFLAALDWDDAPLWLEGAAQSGWSVSAMRQQRWEASGGDEAERPGDSDLVTAELDEDFDAAATSFTQPGQGGGSAKDFGDGPNDIGAGPAMEGPDFGDEEPLSRADDGSFPGAAPQPGGEETPDAAVGPLVQPFAGLPELPSDLADAVELLKLAVLRHKSAGWREVSAETVGQYLKAFSVLVEARAK
jgi:hypothetical protein